MDETKKDQVAQGNTTVGNNPATRIPSLEESTSACPIKIHNITSNLSDIPSFAPTSRFDCELTESQNSGLKSAKKDDRSWKSRHTTLFQIHDN